MDKKNPQNSERHSRFDLQTILDASQLLAQSQDVGFILNNLLLITMGKLMITQGCVLIFEPKENRYRLARTKGKPGLVEEEAFLEDGFEQAAAQTVIDCANADVQLPGLKSDAENGMLFNLQTKDNHIGFLCLGAKSNQQAFSEQEINFVEGLAAVSSVAVANGRIVHDLKQTNRQLDRRNYELNTLLDLSKDFNTLVERKEIARTFKFAMLGQMLIRKFFFLLEQDGRRTMAAANNIDGKLTKHKKDKLFSAVTGRRIVDEELANKIPFLKENQIHALFALEFQNEKLAVVGIGQRANGKPYSKADFRFLQSLGNLALLSIQKTLLLEERIEKERLEKELNIAKSIQQGLLPDPIPAHPNLDVAASNVPSRQVGGDYFDILEMGAAKMLFAIGDVTGKGTPAALLMANLQAIIHVLFPIDISLESATGRMNDMLHQNTPADKFATFFWGIFDSKSSAFSYVNAGHNPVLLFKKGYDQPQKLDDGGLILGAMPTMTPYKKNEVEVATDDLLIFYTDGVTEALNPEKTEEYEEARLIKCIQKNRGRSSEEIIKAIIQDVNQWSNNIQYDDITVMALKVQ